MLLFATTIISILSFEYIEKGFIFKSFKIVLGILIALTLYHFITVKVISAQDYGKEKVFASNISWDLQTNNVECHCNLGMATEPGNYDFLNCLNVDLDRKNVVLIGDSHAGSMALSLKQYFVAKDFNFMQATFTGDAPIINRYGKSPEFDKVVNYLYKDFFPTNKDNINLVIVDLKYTAYKSVVVEMEQMQKYFNELKIKVIFIGQKEMYNLAFEKVAKLKYKYPWISIDNYIEESANEFNIKMKRKFSSDVYIDVYGIKDINQIKNDSLYMFDNNHLSYYGSKKVVEYLSKNQSFKKAVN